MDAPPFSRKKEEGRHPGGGVQGKVTRHHHYRVLTKLRGGRILPVVKKKKKAAARNAQIRLRTKKIVNQEGNWRMKAERGGLGCEWSKDARNGGSV